MKKVYTLFILSFLCLTGIVAQDLTYPLGQHLNVTVEDTSFESYMVNIETTVPEAITYKWTLITNTLPSAWDYSLCDWQTCYIFIPNSSAMDSISLTDAQNGIKGFFSLAIIPGSNYGSGILAIHVYDAKDINRGDTISMTIENPNLVGIKENSAVSLLSIYPNPTQNKVTFNNKSFEKVDIEIYSAIGTLVMQDVSLANQSTSIDLSKLDRGIYFVTIVDNNGMRKTEKLILQ